MKKDVFGDSYQTDYGDIAGIVFQYRVDATDLTAKELSETLCLADGGELPLSHATFTYDEAAPDPAAPDSPLAGAFDETAEKKQITVVFASGAPEEQTCQYTVPADLPAYIQYQGKFAEPYEDAACTQPFAGRDGRTEFTVYVKAGD